MSYTDPDVFRALHETMGDKRIAQHFGVSVGAIRYWRRKHGLPPSPARNIGNSKYTVDRTFFQSIDTPEKAYILGLLITDGFVAGTRLGIELKESDAAILHAVRDAMHSTHPVRTHFIPTGYKPHTMVQLVISSADLVKQLKFFGVIPNKTGKVFYPSIPLHLENHLIRGLIDGNGNINAWNFQLAGTVALIEGTARAIEDHTAHHLSWYDNNGLRHLVGYRRDASVLRWVYQDATLCLSRKYNAFQRHWSQFPGAQSVNLPDCSGSAADRPS